MKEIYFSEAVVLDREPTNGMDSRFSIYAKGFGKIVVKGKSTRKITSKLSGHLEPGNVVKARFVEKNGLQVVDALKSGKLDVGCADLYLLNQLLPEQDFDLGVWEMLTAGIKHQASGVGYNVPTGAATEKTFDWRNALKILGWDPAQAACGNCRRRSPDFFNIQDQGFYCAECTSNRTSLLIEL